MFAGVVLAQWRFKGKRSSFATEPSNSETILERSNDNPLG